MVDSEPDFAALLALSFSLNCLLASKFAFRFTCFCQSHLTLSVPAPSTSNASYLDHSARKCLNHPCTRSLQHYSNTQTPKKNAYKPQATPSHLLSKALVQLDFQVVASSKELLHGVILMTLLEIHDQLPQSNRHPLNNRDNAQPACPINLQLGRRCATTLRRNIKTTLTQRQKVPQRRLDACAT